MGETIYDPRDVSTTTSGQGTSSTDRDPRDNSTILGTPMKRISSTEHGAGVPWTSDPEANLPDYVNYSPPALSRIKDAAVEGFREPVVQTPYLRGLFNKGPLGSQIYNPALDGVRIALGVLNGAGRGLGQGAYEIGAMIDPRLGRDLAMGTQVAGALVPQLAGPRAGMRPDFSPSTRPGFVSERMASPPIEGQTTLGRAIDLLRHDQKWTDPETPGYQPPGVNPNQPGFVPPGATLPMSGPPAGGVPDALLTRALDQERPRPEPTPAPPVAAPVATPVSSAGAKQVASQYYAVADKSGGQLTPRFTNQWLDTISTSAEQSDWGKAAAGSNPVVDLIGRLQGQRDQPMSLAAMQEVDQAISKQISRQYGAGGSMRDAADLLDIQHKLRDQIAAAGEGDVVGGKAGFDALQPARKAWSQAIKMDDLERMKERADQTANPTTSFKTQVTNYRLNRTKSRGWSDDEIDALKDAADRGVIGGGLHLLGSRLLPLVTAAVTGGASGGLLGTGAGWVAGQAAGAGIRALGDTLAARRVANALEVLNRGVPPPPQ